MSSYLLKLRINEILDKKYTDKPRISALLLEKFTSLLIYNKYHEDTIKLECSIILIKAIVISL